MIVVLRLGHRRERDKRISTHVGLVSRALGASGIVYNGDNDEKMIQNIEKVVEDFGGFFSVKHCENWKDVVHNAKDHGFKIVHMTAYGLPIQKKIKEIRRNQKIMVVVGGEKVPSEVFEKSDYNIAIGNQPHSEVAALSIFLHEYYKGKELDQKFHKAKKEIIPQEHGKLVRKEPHESFSNLEDA